MLDKFSGEIEVCNWLRQYLIKKEYKVLQLISSGGQATYSITYYSQENKIKKTIFPDLIAYNNYSIIIGEIKENFSLKDVFKLSDLEQSVNGELKIKNLLNRITKEEFNSIPINYLLIHSEIEPIRISNINQLVLGSQNYHAFRMKL